MICASGGVWRVADAGNEQIVLAAHEDSAVKTLPVENNEIIRMIVSKQVILEVIERVAYVPTIQAPNDKYRRSLYTDAMAKYDEIEWLKVIKSVYLRKQDGRLMPGEDDFSERAKTYLHGEISVLLGIPMDAVEKHIASAVANDNW